MHAARRGLPSTDATQHIAAVHGRQLPRRDAPTRPLCEDWCNKWVCSEPNCNACGVEHGCGWRHETVVHVRCAPWCNENTCDEGDCYDCQDTDGCPRPPSPPWPPPLPNDPPAPPIPPPPPCTQGDQYGLSCMQSRCCEDPRHTCFRKSGHRGSLYGYAQCLVTCPDDASYDCEVIEKAEPPPPAPPPDWTPRTPSPPTLPDPLAGCSERWTTCWWTHCCHDPADGCYRRAGKQFAMCKPRVDNCVDDENWICPGWDSPPPAPPPAAPSPPNPPPPPPNPPPAPPTPPPSPNPPGVINSPPPPPPAGPDVSTRLANAIDAATGHLTRARDAALHRAKGASPMLLAVVALAGLVVCAGLLVGCYLLLCNKRRRGRQKPTLRQRRKYTRQGTELTNGHGGRDEEESEEEEEEEEAATTRKPSSRQAEDAAENGEAASPNGKAAHVDAAAAPPLNDILSQISTILPPAQEQNGSVPDPDRHLVDL